MRRLYAILKRVAPEAEEAIKWGTPFFVEPRLLFAFSAHKAHLDFAPTAAGVKAFRQELEKHKTTKHFLQIPYNQSLPEDLIRKIAAYRVRVVRERKDDAFRLAAAGCPGSGLVSSSRVVPLVSSPSEVF